VTSPSGRARRQKTRKQIWKKIRSYARAPLFGIYIVRVRIPRLLNLLLLLREDAILRPGATQPVRFLHRLHAVFCLEGPYGGARGSIDVLASADELVDVRIPTPSPGEGAYGPAVRALHRELLSPGAHRRMGPRILRTDHLVLLTPFEVDHGGQAGDGGRGSDECLHETGCVQTLEDGRLRNVKKQRPEERGDETLGGEGEEMAEAEASMI
jgi:hypothetical protein